MRLTIDGTAHDPDVPGEMPLLWAIRDVVGSTGVRRVVQVGSGVAVVAHTPWAAFAGRKALRVTYASGPNATVSTAARSAHGRDLVFR